MSVRFAGVRWNGNECEWVKRVFLFLMFFSQGKKTISLSCLCRLAAGLATFEWWWKACGAIEWRWRKAYTNHVFKSQVSLALQIHTDISLNVLNDSHSLSGLFASSGKRHDMLTHTPSQWYIWKNKSHFMWIVWMKTHTSHSTSLYTCTGRTKSNRPKGESFRKH